MRGFIISCLKKIHHVIPVPVRNIYVYFINLIKRLSYYYIPLYTYSGKEHKSGEPLKVACLVRDKTIPHYWMQRLFQGNCRITRNKKLAVWNLAGYFGRNREDYDLAIIEINNPTRKYTEADTGYLLHRWLEMQINTRTFMKRAKKNDIARRIRKYQFRFEVRNTDEDFKFFHQRMYVPYICSRHKESAVICDLKYFLDIYRKKDAQLGFLMADDEPVAGVFTEMRGDKLRISASGILDGREDIMRMGVNSAIYFFIVHDCLNKGIDSVSIGGTSSILMDGLTRYKLSLGAEAEDLQYFYTQYLWLKPLKNTEAVRSFLKANPFINLCKEGLYRSVFIDPSEYEDKSIFFKYLHLINCGNIKGTRIYCFGNKAKIAAWVEEEGYADFEVMDFTV
jgi:hypothetical protein